MLKEQSSVQLKQDVSIDPKKESGQNSKNKEQEIIEATETNELFNRLF